MHVYFLRHGKAAPRAEWQGDDAARPLTPAGEEEMRRGAEALRALDLGLEVIVSSPLVRARQTADIVAAALDAGTGVVEDARLGHGFDTGRLTKLLADHAPAQSIMIVGHEPEFSTTIAKLVGGGAIVLKKGGLARVDLPTIASGGGRLVWLLTPSLLGSR